jgi:hypothetical protein
LVKLPIQQQFPPYQTDVFPAVSAIGIPMSPLPANEFNLTNADDSDKPMDDPIYGRDFDASFLSPQTQAVLNDLNAGLDQIANNPTLMNSLDERPFLAATEDAFTKAENNASMITDDSDKGVKTTIDCIRATKAKVAPTYYHLRKQACNFDEVDASTGIAQTARFWKKLGRAVLRVVAAVVVTAVVVAAVVVVAKLTGGAGLAVAAKVAGKVLVKGIALGGFKLQPVLATGAAAGIKNAYKNWDKPWQGSSEFIAGFKLKW